LKLALELGLLHTPSGSVRAESEHPTLGLVFFWTLPPKWDRRGRTLREDATAETLDGFPRLGVALPALFPDEPPGSATEQALRALGFDRGRWEHDRNVLLLVVPPIRAFPWR
jgi:hypothetical protein